MPEDAVTAAPDIYKVLAENDRVRVLESRMKPGDKTAMHAHPQLVAVSIGNAKVRFVGPDGEIGEAEFAPGQTMIMDATEHTTENIGVNEATVVLIELK